MDDNSTVTREDVVELWTWLESAFGSTFRAKWADHKTTLTEWHRALVKHNVSGDQIEKARDRIERESLEFPPGLPAFLKFCGIKATTPAHKVFELPEHKKSTPEIAEKNLNLMYRRLNASRKPSA